MLSGNARSGRIVKLAWLVVLVGSPGGLAAEPFTIGNILVTRVNTINEYTLEGALVQSIPVPHPDTQRYQAGDVVYDRAGNIHVWSYAPFSTRTISSYNPTTDVWRHVPVPISMNNTSDGDLSILGNWLFRRDVRLDLQSSGIVRLETELDPIVTETSVGRDGMLYSIGANTPRHEVQQIDPVSLKPAGPLLSLRHNIRGSRLEVRGITADKDGNLFAGDFDGRVWKFAPDGTYLADFPTGLVGLHDINLRGDGLLMAANRWGKLVITDTAFSFLNEFDLGPGEAYSAFVSLPVPEPRSLLLPVCLCVGVASRFCRRNRRRGPQTDQSLSPSIATPREP